MNECTVRMIEKMPLSIFIEIFLRKLNFYFYFVPYYTKYFQIEKNEPWAHYSRVLLISTRFALTGKRQLMPLKFQSQDIFFTGREVTAGQLLLLFWPIWKSGGQVTIGHSFLSTHEGRTGPQKMHHFHSHRENKHGCRKKLYNIFRLFTF